MRIVSHWYPLSPDELHPTGIAYECFCSCRQPKIPLTRKGGKINQISGAAARSREPTVGQLLKPQPAWGEMVGPFLICFKRCRSGDLYCGKRNAGNYMDQPAGAGKRPLLPGNAPVQFY